MPPMTTDLQLDRDASAGEVAACVLAQGIAVLPAYYDAGVLARLSAEFDECLATSHELGFNRSQAPDATTIAVVRNRLAPNRFPTLSKVFSAPYMAEIAQRFYGPATVVLNHQIYVNQNHGTAEALADLPFVPHFDKIQTLKFFVYLRDTSTRTGAMGVVPGSHLANRAARLACYAENEDFRAVRNLVDGLPLLPVDGPAGTLFVFDTDVTHQAGHVALGGERRIMRGHTRTLEQLRSLRLEAEGAGCTLGDAA